MLFNLSLKNFRKSIRDYSIYFFTLILGVAVFYIFNAIETQSAMLEVSRTKENILQIMNSILEGVSLVISFILGYLIVYASSFMLKRRKKEFGIYLILGMKKRQVAGILWLETVFMGMISLAAGLIIGIGLSQFMSLLVSNLFEADVSAFRFVVSAKAVGKTILYFLVIYLVVMFLNTFAVSRARLVDFLLAKRKKEKNLLKHPLLCVLIFYSGMGNSGPGLLQCDGKSGKSGNRSRCAVSDSAGLCGNLSGVLVGSRISGGNYGKTAGHLPEGAEFFYRGGNFQ